MKTNCPYCLMEFDIEEPGKYQCPRCKEIFTFSLDDVFNAAPQVAGKARQSNDGTNPAADHPAPPENKLKPKEKGGNKGIATRCICFTGIVLSCFLLICCIITGEVRYIYECILCLLICIIVLELVDILANIEFNTRITKNVITRHINAGNDTPPPEERKLFLKKR